jgi:hypothetical protein
MKMIADSEGNAVTSLDEIPSGVGRSDAAVVAEEVNSHLERREGRMPQRGRVCEEKTTGVPASPLTTRSADCTRVAKTLTMGLCFG